MKTLTKPNYTGGIDPIPSHPIPAHWETDLEIERTIYAAPAKPRATIHPAIIIAAVDGLIMGLWIILHPELAAVLLTNFKHIKEELK